MQKIPWSSARRVNSSLGVSMPFRSLAVSALLCCFFLAPSPAWADAEAAKAAYMRGVAQQKAGQYQAALSEYEASLQAEPRYVYSYKQMGTCYYYLGQKGKAVAAYDKYLAAYPNDTAIRKFADSIRPSVVAAVDEGPTNAIYTNTLALALTLFNVGWEHRMGGSSFKVEGLFRSFSNPVLSGYSDNVTIMGGAFGWRFFPGGKRDLSGFFAGPGINILSISETVTAPAGYYFTETGTNTVSSSALFYGFGGEIGYQWIFGKSFLLAPAASFSFETGGASSSYGGVSTYSVSGATGGIYLNMGYAF